MAAREPPPEAQHRTAQIGSAQSGTPAGLERASVGGLVPQTGTQHQPHAMCSTGARRGRGSRDPVRPGDAVREGSAPSGRSLSDGLWGWVSS